MNLHSIQSSIDKARQENAAGPISLEKYIILSLAEKHIDYINGKNPNAQITITKSGATFIDLVFAGAIGGASIFFITMIAAKIALRVFHS